MAAPRKRQSPGFSSKTEDAIKEVVEIEELLDDVFVETFEKFSEEEDVIPEIVPTEDPGPRFMEISEPDIDVEPEVTTEKKLKRHPRNLAKFSRIVNK